MNKFFTKLAAAFVGMAMAVGVGVAVGNRSDVKAVKAETSSGTASFNLGSNANVTNRWAPGKGSSASYSNSSIATAWAKPNPDSGSHTYTDTMANADGNGQKWTVTYSYSGAYSVSYTGGAAGTANMQFGKGSNPPTTMTFVSTAFTKAMRLSSFSCKYGNASNTSTVKGSLYYDSTLIVAGNATAVGSGDTTETVSYTTGTLIIPAGSSLKVAFSDMAHGMKVYEVSYTLANAESYTVTYNKNDDGASGTIPNGTGASITIAECTMTPPEGKLFFEWNTQPNGQGSSYLPGTTVTANLDLYAIWTNKKSVTYHPNSEEGDSDYVQYFASGADVTIIDNTAETSNFTVPSGYAFNGWNTAANGSGVAKAAGDVLEDQDSNLEFYAQWQQMPTVVYNDNGKTGGSVPTDSNSPYIYNSEVTVLGNTGSLVKTGYEFSGWNTAPNGSGTTYYPGNVFNITESTILYAKWVKLSTSVTFTYGTDVTDSTTLSKTENGKTVSLSIGAEEGTFNTNGNNAYKVFKGKDLTISSAYPIAKIYFTCTANGSAQYGPGCFVTKSGNGFYSFESSGSHGTWAGNDTSIVLTASSNQVRPTSIVVSFVDLPDITISGDSSVKAGSTITLTSDVDGVTWSSSDTNIATVNSSTGVVTGVAYSASTVTITASKSGYDSGTKTITVGYADVTSVEITTKTDELSKLDSFTFGATVLPAKANQAVTWSVVDKVGSEVESGNIIIDENSGELTVAASDSCEITITATTIGKNSSSLSISDSIDVSITGNAVVVVSSSISGYSGKNANLAYSFNNFTDSLSVVSGDTSKVTVGTPTVTSGTSGSGTVRVNFVADTGLTPVTLSFKHGSTVVNTCSVTVTASAVSSVTWSGEDMVVYSGTTITPSYIEDNWEPSYEMNNGDSDYITSDYIIKLGGVAIDLPHTWAASDSGKTLTLTYGGVTTSANNPVITVVQSLNTINKMVPYSHTSSSKWSSYSSAQTLSGVSWNLSSTWKDGSAPSVGNVDATKGQQIGTAADYATAFSLSTSGISGTVTSITVYTSGANDINASLSVTVGSTSFKCNENTSVSLTSTNTGYTFTGSASGNVTLSWSNSSAKAMYFKSVSITHSTGLTTISNSDSHKAAQAAVVEFAQYLNEQMNGTNVCSGTKENRDTAWANVKAKYATLFGPSRTTTFDGDELAWAKDLLANANAVWNGEYDSDEQYCLERAMATYEYCVEHYYSGDAFMSAVRPLTARTDIGFTIQRNDDTTTIAIVIVSLISLSAIGGFFFLRKRKEER